jgi:hypothetical protein
MSLVRWRFAVVLGVLGAVLQACSVALPDTSTADISKTAASSVGVLPYLLFALAVPYLAITRQHQWWLSTTTTVWLAWLIMVVVELPSVFVATWIVASRSAASFVVGESSGRLLIVAPAGVVVLAVLSFVLGGVVRRLARLPAA